MPYPSKVTAEAILARAALLVDGAGLDALSLRGLGAALGVRAPSLYNYYPDKESLVRALAALFMGELSAAVAGHHTLGGFARAYRAHALAYPRRYAVIFRVAPEAERPPLAAALQATEPLLALAARYDAERPLPLARALWSYLHGAVSLDLSFGGRTREGLDAGKAFEVGLALLERGLAPREPGEGGL